MTENTKKLEELLVWPAMKTISSMILYFVSVFHLRMKTTEGLKEHLSNIRKLTYKPKACFDEYYFRA